MSLLCPLRAQNPSSLGLSDLTYGQLDDSTSRAVSGLRSLGLKAGDRIAFKGETRWQTICLLFAAWRLSLTAALLSPRLPLISLEKHLSLLAPALFIEDPALFFTNPRDLNSSSELSLSPLALFLLTSGSSGTPKWAAFTLRQLFESAHTVSHALAAAPQDLWLLSLPLYHVGGLGVLLRAFLSSGTLVLADKKAPLSERIVSSRARFASLIPTQLYRLLKEDPIPISTQLLIGGAPLSESLYRRALDRSLSLSLSYGLTEMTSTVLLSSSPVWQGPFPYLGFPLPGREVRIDQEEIFVRGAPLFEGYGCPPLPIPSWFRTNDRGHFHERFGFSISGRKDLQFISGGENIQPEEIELALLSHPDIEQAIVTASPDEEFGARPIAFVRTTLSSDDLKAYLAQLLPTYKIPIAFNPLKELDALKPNRKIK